MRKVWTVSLIVISVFLGLSSWSVLAEERTVRTIDGPKTLEFKVGKDGKEMVWIPDGTFQMGDRWGDGRPDERPVHTVAVDGFWMDTTEVINAEFNRFIEATGYEVEGSWKYNPDEPNYAAQYVSWNDAAAYAKWADKRLPTEAGGSTLPVDQITVNIVWEMYSMRTNIVAQNLDLLNLNLWHHYQLMVMVYMI